MADLDSFGGAPSEIIDQLAEESTDLEIDPENWLTVSLFCKSQTQWRVGMGGPTGLDYSGVESLLRIYRVKDRQEVFEGIQIMEAAALAAMNKG